MISKRWLSWVVLLVLGGIGAGTAVAQEALAAKRATPAATVGTEVITIEEVEQAVQPQLAKLEAQRYEILAKKLDQLTGERLLAQQAKTRNVSMDQLLKTEVDAKVPDVAEADVAAFIKQNRSRLPKMDEQELRLKVLDRLRSQKLAEQRQAYIPGLGSQAKVTVLLEEPASTRDEASGDRGFVRGPKDAPVTIVEFSDFQCPFCKTANTTIKKLLDMYRGKVRLVFRDYPLAGLHPQAPKAHEAARCAGEQGKFWEYHDLLFERSPRLSPQDLKQYAQRLNLDGAAFAECLDSGKQAADIDKDVQEGMRRGVTGTPSFFINGRQLVGAQPPARFRRIIDNELSKEAAKQ